jgi:hypothetical protein
MTSEMRAPVTMAEIERRLRFAAPDEPTVLPRLLLPTDAAAVRGSIRLRPRGGPARNPRVAYVVLALLLAFAVAVAAGSLRLLQDSNDPLSGSCGSYAVVLLDPYGPECRPVTVPDGWVVLGEGQLFPGAATEPGLDGEIVSLVMATDPLGSCASPGGPMPTGISMGSNVIHVPEPTPDGGLACVRSAALPENAIRVEVVHGRRVLGIGPDGFALPDLSEPTEAAGWTEEVDGRPARLTVEAGGPGQPAETRTWDVLQPGSIEMVLRIRAAIGGPDLEAGRAAVQHIVDTVEFKATAPGLEEAKANDVLRELLDALERNARGEHSDFYGCFPREPGAADGTIAGGPAAPLASRLEVRCASAIEASRAGVWRIALEASWEATGGSPADAIRMEYHTSGERFGNTLLWSGGYPNVRSGRPMPEAGIEGWFPNSGYELPPALGGPLNLPPGSIAKVLWPGEAVAQAAGQADDAIYPGRVNTRLYVIDGPELIDGEEWYRVEGGSGMLQELGWFRGTRDGRPQLELVAPGCPAGDPDVGDLSWLISAERLLCFGDRELVLDAVLTSDDAWGPPSCGDASGQETACPDPDGEPAWLANFPRWTLFGPGGASGPLPGFHVWLDPSVSEPISGQSVRIRGHFDDPAAATCQLPDVGQGAPANPALDSLVCRERFVITAIEPR